MNPQDPTPSGSPAPTVTPGPQPPTPDRPGVMEHRVNTLQSSLTEAEVVQAHTPTPPQSAAPTAYVSPDPVGQPAPSGPVWTPTTPTLELSGSSGRKYPTFDGYASILLGGSVILGYWLIIKIFKSFWGIEGIVSVLCAAGTFFAIRSFKKTEYPNIVGMIGLIINVAILLFVIFYGVTYLYLKSVTSGYGATGGF